MALALPSASAAIFYLNAALPVKLKRNGEGLSPAVSLLALFPGA